MTKALLYSALHLSPHPRAPHPDSAAILTQIERDTENRCTRGKQQILTHSRLPGAIRSVSRICLGEALQWRDCRQCANYHLGHRAPHSPELSGIVAIAEAVLQTPVGIGAYLGMRLYANGTRSLL